jgi:hypothetical protein
MLNTRVNCQVMSMCASKIEQEAGVLPEGAAEANSGCINPTGGGKDGKQWHQVGGGLHKRGHVA